MWRGEGGSGVDARRSSERLRRRAEKGGEHDCMTCTAMCAAAAHVVCMCCVCVCWFVCPSVCMWVYCCTSHCTSFRKRFDAPAMPRHAQLRCAVHMHLMLCASVCLCFVYAGVCVCACVYDLVCVYLLPFIVTGALRPRPHVRTAGHAPVCVC